MIHQVSSTVLLINCSSVAVQWRRHDTLQRFETIISSLDGIFLCGNSPVASVGIFRMFVNSVAVLHQIHPDLDNENIALPSVLLCYNFGVSLFNCYHGVHYNE